MQKTLPIIVHKYDDSILYKNHRLEKGVQPPKVTNFRFILYMNTHTSQMVLKSLFLSNVETINFKIL